MISLCFIYLLSTRLQTIAELRRTVTANSSQISSLESQLTEAQSEGQASVKRAEQAVAECSNLRAEAERLRDSLKTSQEETEKVRLYTFCVAVIGILRGLSEYCCCFSHL